MYLMAKLFRRPILKTLKFIKTKELCAYYRKIALTVSYSLKALRTPVKRPWAFSKRPWAFAPPKRPSYATGLNAALSTRYRCGKSAVRFLGSQRLATATTFLRSCVAQALSRGDGLATYDTLTLRRNTATPRV